jgi:RecB family exonuclease
MLEISHSEIVAFKGCKRRWYLNYVLGRTVDPLRSSPVGAAQLGTRVHLCLEAYYGYGIDPLEVLKWDYADTISLRPDYQEDLEREQEYALAMVEGYLEWVAEEGTDFGYEIVETERELKARIATPEGDVILRGKLDQIVRRELDDVLLCRDFKTVGTLQKVDSLVLGTQLRHYALLQNLTAPPGQRVEGGIFIMLRRTKRGVKAKPPFYANESVHLNKEDLNSYWLQVRDVTADMIRCRRRLGEGEDHRAVVYANPTDFCNWGCSYKLQCPMFDDGSRAEAAVESAFIQGDPYAYYSENRISKVKTAFGFIPKAA